MFIVDKQIAEKCSNKELIAENYDETNVGAISYDLTLDEVIVNTTEHDSYNGYVVEPNQTVFVSTKEIVRIPDNYLGIVSEKNSVMREGLVVSAPIYQPGHRTRCFLRVINISSNEITISKGKKIAQILFYQLDNIPNTTYSNRQDASFNDEIKFRGLGNYESEYKKEIKIIEKAEKDLEDKANTIYANVLTFMGIIATIFTLITINFEAFKSQNFSKIEILSLNLTIAFAISVLMGIILIFINKKRKWWTYLIFALVTVGLLLVNIFLCTI